MARVVYAVYCPCFNILSPRDTNTMQLKVV